MVHDEYKLTTEKVAEQDARSFDWSQRRTLDSMVSCRHAKYILVDIRLANYEASIRTWVGRIASEHGDELKKAEVIIGRWELDENFSTVLVRWTSTRGTFMREFAVDSIVHTERVLVDMPVREAAHTA